MKNSLEMKIDKIISGLTLKEKIGQLNQLSAPLDNAGKEILKNRIRKAASVR